MSYLMNTTTTAIYTLSLHDALPISQLNVREHRSNIPNNACHDGQRKLVELHPLAEDAVVREAAPHHAEELWRVQRGDTCEPGITRLRDHDVVLRRIDLQGAARVVHDHREVGTGEGGVVDVPEESIHLEHGRLDLHHANAPHSGDVCEDARGHAGQGQGGDHIHEQPHPQGEVRS